MAVALTALDEHMDNTREALAGGRAAAVELRGAGFSPLPIRLDGSKAPACQSWKPFRERPATLEEIQAWPSSCGVGVVCGQVSGGLEVLDFDDKDVFGVWRELVSADGLAQGLELSCPIIETPNGYHVYLRRAEPAPGTKLAMATDGKTLIEIRGEGNYVVAPGSPAEVHATGREYRVMDGIPLAAWGNLRPLADDLYQPLIALARSLNEQVDAQVIWPTSIQAGKSGLDSARPGDEFNQRATWDEILSPRGWRIAHARGNTNYWCRPGKEKGCSATTGHCSSGTVDLFYVFSSNAAPFEMARAYSKFAVYTLLEHGGDFSLAAKELATRGFGGEETAELDEAHREKDVIEAKIGALEAKKEREAELTADRPTNIATLQRLLGIPIARWVQTRIENSLYTLVLEDGDEIVIGSVTDVQSARIFEGRVYERLGVTLLAGCKKAARWDKVIRLLAQIREVEDEGFREREQTQEWIHDYLDRVSVFCEENEEGWQGALPDCSPFVRDEVVMIHVSALRKYLLFAHNETITPAHLWQRLRGAGFRRETVSAKIDDRTVNRSYWSISVDELMPDTSGAV